MLSEAYGDRIRREEERAEAHDETLSEVWDKVYTRVYPKVYEEVLAACLLGRSFPESHFGLYASGHAASNALIYAVEDYQGALVDLIDVNGNIRKLYEAYAAYVAKEEAEYAAEGAVQRLEAALEGDEE